MYSKHSFIVSILAGTALASPVEFPVQGLVKGDDTIYGCPTGECNTDTNKPEDIYVAFSDYPKDKSGNTIAYFKFPEPDNGCKYILKSLAGLTAEENCGIVKITVTTAQCVKATLCETYFLQFCCGSGDCQKATGIGRRDPLSGAMIYDSITYEKSGKSGKPAPYLIGPPGNESSKNMTSQLQSRLSISTPEDVAIIERLLARERLFHLLELDIERAKSTKKRELSSFKEDALLKEESLAKRACAFHPTSDSYAKLADNVFFAGGPVSCEGSESCDVQITETYSQTSTVEASVSISDPFGILSTSMGFSFSSTTEHSMSSTFSFPPASVGYVSATPILQCWKGHFDGCDSDNGREVEVCRLNPVAPTEVLSAVITG